MFWILDENSDDNMPMSLVVTEQLLHKAKDFSDAKPAKRLGLQKEHNQDRRPELARRMFHAAWSYIQLLNLE